MIGQWHYDFFQCKIQQFWVHTNKIMKIMFYSTQMKFNFQVLEKRGNQVPLLKFQFSLTIVPAIDFLFLIFG